MKFYDRLKRSYDKQINGRGLAIFRMFYCLILLCEISQIFYFRHLIFDKIPYIELSEIEFGIPIGIWLISVLFLFFGLFTRFFSVLNYIMGLILIGSINTYEYHVFYAYMGINFLFMFMPISQCLSLDRLINKLKYSNTTFQYNPPQNISQLYYFIPVLSGLALVYFDSVFWKLGSPMWYNGLGVWEPSSLPMIVHTNTSWLLNNEILVKFLGYLTLVFEAVFLFVFFRKKWRVPLLIIGLGLHLGILVTFPIPWFALIACSIYILMIPVIFWDKIFNRKSKTSKLDVFYDTECPLCVRTKITVNHLSNSGRIKFLTVQYDAAENKYLKDKTEEQLLTDIHSVDINGNVYAGVNTYIQIMRYIWYLYPISLVLRVPGIFHFANAVYGYVAKNRTKERCTDENCGYDPPSIPDDSKFKLLHNLTLKDLKFKLLHLYIVMAIVLQGILIYHSYLSENIQQALGFNDSKVDVVLEKSVSLVDKVSKTLLGVTHHVVFTDKIHFDSYDHVVAVAYIRKDGSEKLLPIIDDNGSPSKYIYSFNWVKWTFRVNGINVDQNKLEKGVRDFTAFWAHKNGVSLTDAKFKIKVKKIESSSVWKDNHLEIQMNKPWIDGGYVEWKNDQYYPSIKEIEKL